MVLNFGLSEILSLESGVYIFGLQAPPLPTHLASHCSKLSATGKCRTEQGETRTGRSAHGGSPAGRTSKTSSSWTKPSMKVLKWLLSTFHHLSYWERHCARFVNDLTMWQCDWLHACMTLFSFEAKNKQESELDDVELRLLKYGRDPCCSSVREDPHHVLPTPWLQGHKKCKDQTRW